MTCPTPTAYAVTLLVLLVGVPWLALAVHRWYVRGLVEEHRQAVIAERTACWNACEDPRSRVRIGLRGPLDETRIAERRPTHG